LPGSQPKRLQVFVGIGAGCAVRSSPTVHGICEMSTTVDGPAVEETLLCLEWDFCLKSNTEKPRGH